MSNYDTVVGIALVIFGLAVYVAAKISGHRAKRMDLQIRAEIAAAAEEHARYKCSDFCSRDQDVPYDQEIDISEFERAFRDEESC